MRFNIGCNVLIPSSGQRAVYVSPCLIPDTTLPDVYLSVFEDMKALCRKYCPRELNEIDDVFDASALNSAIDGGELEYEDEGAKENLDNSAADMGLESGDLLIGLQRSSGGEQKIPMGPSHEKRSNLDPDRAGGHMEVM